MNSNKAFFVWGVANGVLKRDTTMTVQELIEILNFNHFKTEGNDVYKGGRGSYHFISELYQYFVQMDNQEAADDIAAAFTKSDGSYAYEVEKP